MKAILISIKPEWVVDILNGKKTIEIRKTAPKCDLPIDVYIYCTKGGGYLQECELYSSDYPFTHNAFIVFSEEIHANTSLYFWTSFGKLGKTGCDTVLASIEENLRKEIDWNDYDELYAQSPINGKVVAKFTLRNAVEYINGCNVTKDSGYMFGDAEREGVYEKACLSIEEVDEYCPDESFYAWHISDIVIFDEPKPLSDFGLKRAPQSYCYIER